jgi:hypothetical protein
MRNIGKLLAAVGATLLMAACAGPGASIDGAALAEKMKSSETFALDENGYIRHWLLLGPINFGDNYNAQEIEKEQVAGEAVFTPKAGDKVKVSTEEGEPGAYKTVQKDLTWIRTDTEENFFDFNAALKLEVSDGMGGYAVAYLDAPEEMKGISLNWCSNDNGTIYLNGKSVGFYVGGRSLTEPESADMAENLTLHKGINVVVFKVWNDSNNWQGFVRVLKDGKPATTVKTKLPK